MFHVIAFLALVFNYKRASEKNTLSLSRSVGRRQIDGFIETVNQRPERCTSLIKTKITCEVHEAVENL
jgi:hypothetical protein